MRKTPAAAHRRGEPGGLAAADAGQQQHDREAQPAPEESAVRRRQAVEVLQSAATLRPIGDGSGGLDARAEPIGLKHIGSIGVGMAEPLYQQAVVDPCVQAMAELSKPGVEVRTVEVVCTTSGEESTELAEDALVWQRRPKARRLQRYAATSSSQRGSGACLRMAVSPARVATWYIECDAAQHR
jgi:hypothetical protein